jgi:asparagine synthase (glutamine-hydrolysing)
MCGITGIFAFNLVGKMNMIHLTNATRALASRGPDFHDSYHDGFAGLGHRRLSIIDTSAAGNQPMWDETGRYAIVFNGEIFNFNVLRQELEHSGTSFFSHSDTEVLLKLYLRDKEKCLNRLNGFFAFCIYDKQEQTFFLARDRYGIKPLLYLMDEDKFLFASEMKALLQYGIDKQLDFTSLLTYLQLNYIPAPHTIFTHVKKLRPGHYLHISRGKAVAAPYYEIPYNPVHVQQNTLSYAEAQQQLVHLLEAAVQRRLVSDVPLGAFLSGGIDSSVITALASRHKPDLQTFSIGFTDDPYFDETRYANRVAKHFNTRHTVFSLTTSDLFDHLTDVLEYTDEPFADSSAVNVFILSKHTRKHATVALSGDGADELLAGYTKHQALWQSLHPGWKEKLVAAFHPVWNALPHSRNNAVTNRFRQLARMAKGMRMPLPERYWYWATFANRLESAALLKTTETGLGSDPKDEWLAALHGPAGMNELLLTDMQLVLPNDMLTKVDLMSMANSLEVRTPFLDVDLVNFVFGLPAEYKIYGTMRKRLLQDAFRTVLPAELYNRPKKGFEVPLRKWLLTELRPTLETLLSKDAIQSQGIFNYLAIDNLKRKLRSSNPGDAHARLWALLVFQWWWKKYV